MMKDYSQILYGFNVLYYPKDTDKFGNEIEPKEDFDEFSGMEFTPPYENVATEAYCTFIGSDFFPDAAGVSKVTIQNFPEELKYSDRPIKTAIDFSDVRDVPSKLTFRPKDGFQAMIDITETEEGKISVTIEDNEICAISLDDKGYGTVDYNFANIGKYFECSELFYDGFTHEVVDIENNPNLESNLKTLSELLSEETIENSEEDSPVKDFIEEKIDDWKERKTMRKLMKDDDPLADLRELKDEDIYRGSRSSDYDLSSDGVLDGDYI